MDVILSFMTFLLILVAIGNPIYLRTNLRPLLDGWAGENGFRIVELDVLAYASSSRYSSRPGSARVRLARRAFGDEVSGLVHWQTGWFHLTHITWTSDRLEKYLEAPDFPEAGGHDEKQDRELSVIDEVNRRLDDLTSQPGWMTPYDLDGSGHIDDAEWTILRAQVTEQVKAELGQPGVKAIPGPSAAVVAESPVMTRADEDEEGSW